jgi:hypothetical protein
MSILYLHAFLTLTLIKKTSSSSSLSFTCKQLDDACFASELTSSRFDCVYDICFVNTAVCTNFETFAQLNASACLKDHNASFWSDDYKNVIVYHLKPSTPVALDKSFDLTSFNELIFRQPPNPTTYATFKNTLCLDLDFFESNAYKQQQTYSETIYRFDESTFNFCKNETVIAECDHDVYKNSLSNSAFGCMLSLTLMNKVVLDRKLSPWAFKNAYLDDFSFSIFDHFIFTTRFEFCQDPNATETALNSVINRVEISGYNIKLDTKILHPLVFRSVTVIDLRMSLTTTLFLRTFTQNSQKYTNFYK